MPKAWSQETHADCYAVQGPLSRFGDTAANAGTLSLLESYEATAHLNVGLKTLVASGAAASFRILLMPIDATKTIMQVCTWNFWKPCLCARKCLFSGLQAVTLPSSGTS